MTADVLVVGGGLAGSAAAIALAQAGCDVALVEREREPVHKVCGEFLSEEALGELEALGAGACVRDAVAIEAVRVVSGSGGVACARLPFRGHSLTRRRMDAELLTHAERAGAKVLRGCSVETLWRDGGGWRARLNSGEEVAAGKVLLACGKHDLRGRPRVHEERGRLVAFKMYFELAREQQRELAGHVELMLYRGGYGGLQCVEGGQANLCWLVEREVLRKLGSWRAVLDAMQRECPHLARRLAGARAVLGAPLAVSSIPYGWVRRETEEGLWCVGDQAACIASFTGDGMSIALRSGRAAAASIVREEPADVFQRKLQKTVRAQVKLASAVANCAGTSAGRWAVASALPRWPEVLRLVARRTRMQPMQ